MFRFPQLVQKQMLGEVRTWTVIWWLAVVSEIFVPKLLKSDHPSSTYNQ